MTSIKRYNVVSSTSHRSRHLSIVCVGMISDHKEF